MVLKGGTDGVCQKDMVDNQVPRAKNTAIEDRSFRLTKSRNQAVSKVTVRKWLNK